MDASGRVLVAPELRSAAGITRAAVLLGMGSHFELWDAETYAAQEAEGDEGRDARSPQGFLFLKARQCKRFFIAPSRWTRRSIPFRSGPTVITSMQPSVAAAIRA